MRSQQTSWRNTRPFPTLTGSKPLLDNTIYVFMNQIENFKRQHRIHSDEKNWLAKSKDGTIFDDVDISSTEVDSTEGNNPYILTIIEMSIEGKDIGNGDDITGMREKNFSQNGTHYYEINNSTAHVGIAINLCNFFHTLSRLQLQFHHQCIIHTKRSTQALELFIRLSLNMWFRVRFCVICSQQKLIDTWRYIIVHSVP